MTRPALKAPIRADLGTPERRKHGEVQISGVSRSEKRARAISKLERMHLNGGIDQAQLAAGLKLALHRHYGKMDGHPKPMCLERVDAMGRGGPHGLSQQDHADAYYEACKVVHGRGVMPFLAFVLDDVPKEQCARMLGNYRKQDGLRLMTYIIKKNLRLLAEHWGLDPGTKNRHKGVTC